MVSLPCRTAKSGNLLSQQLIYIEDELLKTKKYKLTAAWK
jgi:hypothetical protein